MRWNPKPFVHINFNRMQSSSSNDKERPTKRPRSKLSEGDEVEPVKSATASGVATRRFFSTENFNTKFQEDLSFPWRLYNLLQLEMFEDLVTWVPNGRAIKIVNEDRFTTEILPRFFPNMSNIKSFKRQLSAYNFSYIRSGKHAGAYHHSDFVRGDPNGCLNIKRKKTFKSKPQEPRARNTTGIAREVPLAPGLFDFSIASSDLSSHFQAAATAYPHPHHVSKTTGLDPYLDSVSAMSSSPSTDLLLLRDAVERSLAHGRQAVSYTRGQPVAAQSLQLAAAQTFSSATRFTAIDPQNSHQNSSDPFSSSGDSLPARPQAQLKLASTEGADESDPFGGRYFEPIPLGLPLISSTSTSQQGSAEPPGADRQSSTGDTISDQYDSLTDSPFNSDECSLEPRTIEEMSTKGFRNDKDRK